MVHMPVWKSFDEIEECLTVDELLLLLDELKQKHKFQIKLAGGEVEDEPEIPEEEIDYSNPFEREMAEMESQFNERKQQLIAEGKISAVPSNPFDDISISYNIEH